MKGKSKMGSKWAMGEEEDVSDEAGGEGCTRATIGGCNFFSGRFCGSGRFSSLPTLSPHPLIITHYFCFVLFCFLVPLCMTLLFFCFFPTFFHLLCVSPPGILPVCFATEGSPSGAGGGGDGIGIEEELEARRTGVRLQPGPRPGPSAAIESGDSSRGVAGLIESAPDIAKVWIGWDGER